MTDIAKLPSVGIPPKSTLAAAAPQGAPVHSSTQSSPVRGAAPGTAPIPVAAIKGGSPAAAPTMAVPKQPPPSLGGGDQGALALGEKGSCSANFCFVDMADSPTRSLEELVDAAQNAHSPTDLQDLADEVQARSGVEDLNPTDVQMVLDEILMNKAVSPHTVNEITQFALEGLNQKETQSTSANLISTIMQSPAASLQAYQTIARLKPDSYPPTVAPYLRQPVQQAQERLNTLNHLNAAMKASP